MVSDVLGKGSVWIASGASCGVYAERRVKTLCLEDVYRLVRI